MEKIVSYHKRNQMVNNLKKEKKNSWNLRKEQIINNWLHHAKTYWEGFRFWLFHQYLTNSEAYQSDFKGCRHITSSTISTTFDKFRSRKSFSNARSRFGGQWWSISDIFCADEWKKITSLSPQYYWNEMFWTDSDSPFFRKSTSTFTKSFLT